MAHLPAEVRPIWRTVQIVYISKGFLLGVGTFIIGPYFYSAFQKVCSEPDALFYATLLWSIYFGLIALLEIPTGALADTIGRVRVVLSSFVLYVLNGLLMMSLFFCDSLVVLLSLGILTRLTSAIGFTFFNGSFSAWVVDSLRETAPEFGYERLLARGKAYHAVAMIVGGVLGTTAYLHDVAYAAYLTGALLSLGCVTYCLAEMEESRSIVFLDVGRGLWGLMARRLVGTMKKGMVLCQQSPVLWWLLGVYAVFKFLYNVVEFLWPVAFGAQFGVARWSPSWYGIVIAIPLAIAGGAQFLAWRGDLVGSTTQRKLDNRRLCRWLMRSFVLAALPIIALSFLNREGVLSLPLFATAILCLQAAYGFVEPCFETIVNNYIPDRHANERATILSMGSFVRAILVLLLTIPSRGSTGMNSPSGWLIPACALVIATLITHWSVRRHETLPVNPRGYIVPEKEALL